MATNLVVSCSPQLPTGHHHQQKDFVSPVRETCALEVQLERTTTVVEYQFTTPHFQGFRLETVQQVIRRLTDRNFIWLIQIYMSQITKAQI